MDAYIYDSKEFPKGPIPDGGAEAQTEPPKPSRSHPSLGIYRTYLALYHFAKDTRHASLNGEEFWYRRGRRVVLIDNGTRPATLQYATLVNHPKAGLVLSLD